MKKYLKRWDIVFDGPSDNFLPGDTVRGRVIMDVINTIVVSQIKVRFKGKAEVTMFIGDYDTQRVSYFNHDKTLFQCPETTESVSLGPGYFEYPFQFTLPLGLPYTFSCEGDESGAIVYVVRATIYRPGKYTFVNDKHFTVLGMLDLNRIHDTRGEMRNIKVKSMSCLAWKQGDITATFNLPRKGYVPGEVIPLHATIDNRSNRRVKRSAISLMQQITMTVFGSTSVRFNKINDSRHGPILPGAVDEWRGEPLLVPQDLLPSSMQSCELIEVRYSLQLVVTPAGLCRKLRVPLDIIVGTVAISCAPSVGQPLDQQREKTLKGRKDSPPNSLIGTRV